jgi:hypothetical protein
MALPRTNQTGTNEWADVETNDQYLYDRLFGNIVNADIHANAAIAHSKLATSTAGYLLIANGSGVITGTAMSGDVTISSAGATTIGANKVGIAEIDNTAVQVGGAVGGSVALTTSEQDVPTSSISITPTVASTLIATAFFEFSLSGTGTVAMNAYGVLDVDGSNQTPKARFSYGDNDAGTHSIRDTVGMSCVVSLSAAAHTLKLQSYLESATSITGTGSLIAANWTYVMVKA